MKILPATVTRHISRQILVTKKQSPHIFFVAGLVGTIASTVLACRATLKLSATLDEIQSDLQGAKDLAEGKDNYPVDELHKDVVYIYTRAGLQLAKLYSPAILVGSVSIACLTGSHVQLARRNTALMAAYAAIQQAYEDYRERVRAEVGEERELELYNAIESQKVGKEVVKTADPNRWSAYARFFDEGSPNWHKDPEINRLFVQAQQNYANNLLLARGHVFLNEVYDMLGIDRSKAGAVVGWVVGKEGDNYVSFGMLDVWNARFINGQERSILLDFNVDGVIYDKI